jgi:hypothetical protein
VSCVYADIKKIKYKYKSIRATEMMEDGKKKNGGKCGREGNACPLSACSLAVLI